MPSSDRLHQGRDRRPGLEGLAADPSVAGGEGRARLDRLRSPEHVDPNEPWDAQSAEALTRLYESGEAYVDCQGERPLARRRQLPQSAPASEQPPTGDNAWLDARLAEMAQRLQDSLYGLNPDKSLAPLAQRLDAIEQRFGEALAQVAQRSDLDGLRLIEANVFELAAHVEQTRGRLDKLETIDDQVRDIARRLQGDDHQRLAALEQLLHGYVAEWRRSDERTANALHTLEEAVNRVGESVEAVEAQRPVPDLSAFALATPELGGVVPDRDPLAQAYADTARALQQQPLRSPLDAADYATRPGPAAEQGPSLPPPLPAARVSAPAGDAESAPATLHSPAFRASAMRAKLRQAQMPRADDQLETVQVSQSAPKTQAAPRSPPPRTRLGLLLAAAFTVFVAGGYLVVDAFMTAAVHRASSGMEHSARPIDPRATEDPAGTGDTKTPAKTPWGADPNDKAPAPGPGMAPANGQTGLSSPAPSPTLARVEAMGNAIAAVFRFKEPAPPPSPPAQPAAVSPKDAPPALEEATALAIATLPMTIGPASLRQAALRGEAAAQVEIAARFATGLGVPRDLQEALRWYNRAAAQGMALAQYRLAMFYERGWGTPPDPERARVWYQRAAEQGNVKAMHNLAVLSVSGGRSDYATAAKWFAQAADLGLADSQFNLAVLHHSGLGMPKDLRLAYKWLALAARTGDREASSRIAEVKAQLTPGDLQEVEAMVAVWRPRTPDPAVNEPAAVSLAP